MFIHCPPVFAGTHTGTQITLVQTCTHAHEYTHTQTHTVAYMQTHKYAPVTGTAAAKRCGGIWSWEPGGTHRPTHPIPEWVGEASAHGGCGRMKGGFYVKLFKNSREQ